tara:strand:+ start:5060 stop:5740 length:681 start_codon:yes stop_codon:yes gene_type:complete
MKHYKPKFDLIYNLINKDDPVILEIGAHFGEDTLRFLETFESPRIYCFEPDPRNCKIFKKYVKDERVSFFQLALSNETGEAEFYPTYEKSNSSTIPSKYDWIREEDYLENKLNSSGGSSLKKGGNHALHFSIKVKTQRFDKWYDDSNLQDIDFVWIDVQGAEKDVFDGMGKQIKNIKYIWVEYGETTYEDAMTRDQTIEYLNAKGFILNEVLSDRGFQGDLLFQRI